MRDSDNQPKDESTVDQSRREFLKGGGVVAGGLAAAAVPGLAAAAEPQTQDIAADTADAPPKNPYGKRPGGGISLPEYYKPWPAIKNRNMFLPGTETLPKNEMRITFLGSSPWPPSRLQKGTSMLVELGNGTAQPRRFFFDMGNQRRPCNRAAGARCSDQRHFHQPSPRGSLCRSPLHVSLPRLFGRLHAAAGLRPIGKDSRVGDQEHGQTYAARARWRLIAVSVPLDQHGRFTNDRLSNNSRTPHSRGVLRNITRYLTPALQKFRRLGVVLNCS